MASACLFVTTSGRNGCLAVVTTARAEVGLVAYEMALLANQLSAHVPTSRRAVPGGAE
jgi:uncharacterized protein